MTICKSNPAAPAAPSESPRREVKGDATFGTRPEMHSAPIRILRLAQVIEVTGLRKTTIYELQAAGQFPMRVQITNHSVGWVEQEVQNWLTRRITFRPTAPGRPPAQRSIR